MAGSTRRREMPRATGRPPQERASTLGEPVPRGGAIRETPAAGRGNLPRCRLESPGCVSEGGRKPGSPVSRIRLRRQPGAVGSPPGEERPSGRARSRRRPFFGGQGFHSADRETPPKRVSPGASAAL
jgi:hypothetical protein